MSEFRLWMIFLSCLLCSVCLFVMGGWLVIDGLQRRRPSTTYHIMNHIYIKPLADGEVRPLRDGKSWQTAYRDLDEATANRRHRGLLEGEE